jgi:acyl-homoserine lactone acylase PvdQ
MVKVNQLLEILPVLLLRPVARDRVCLLDLAKLAAQPRQATLDSPRLLVTDRRARVLQLPLVAERSSGFQS